MSAIIAERKSSDSFLSLLKSMWVLKISY